MNRVFLELFNLSITATWLILAVLLFRVILKKAPKWINCLLWTIVALRLIFPFAIESTLSLVPSAKTVPVEIGMMETPAVSTGITAIDNVINPVITERYAPAAKASVNPLQIVLSVASGVWICGVILFLLYALLSFIRLKRRTAVSTKVEDGIYRCDDIESPFILGLFRPVIYIPSGLGPAAYEFVLSHERAHLKRRDYFWKPFGFVLLAVYWFNPFCWAAYVIFCRDIELACDEKATRDMDRSARVDYCQALLSCSVNRKMLAACPVAFGEVAVKERVKRVLYYKKPSFWIVIVAVIACIAAAVCFLTSPEGEADDSNENLNVRTENNEESIEPAQEEEPNERTSERTSERYTELLKKWANAFCDRDGRTIADMSANQVKEALEEQELLYLGEEHVSFGYSSPWPMWEEGTDGYILLNQDDLNMSGEILYYAWTSDPHVTVWKEYISFEEINGELMVSSEELHYLDSIASGMEFDEAYPAITGTLMDYSVNGMGEALVSNSLLSSSTIYFDLQDPVFAARNLLNLSDDENKVKVERFQDDSEAGVANLKITFPEDGAERLITMERLGDESGIWIPQDYIPPTMPVRME